MDALPALLAFVWRSLATDGFSHRLLVMQSFDDLFVVFSAKLIYCYIPYDIAFAD